VESEVLPSTLSSRRRQLFTGVLGAVTNRPRRAIDIEASEERIYDRCKMLRRAGLVEREHGDHYEISLWGALYLDGEVSTKAMRPLPAPRPPETVRSRWNAGFR